MASHPGCNGCGPCVHVVALLDAAERMMKNVVRTGNILDAEAAARWLAERGKVCPTCPKLEKRDGDGTTTLPDAV